jgi:DNA-directed RNA polymerase specialized sigma24 family protein
MWVQGYTQQEIADEMEMTRKRVTDRISAAAKNISKYLKN